MRGTSLGGPYSTDYHFLGSMLESPYLWKVRYQALFPLSHSSLQQEKWRAMAWGPKRGDLADPNLDHTKM